MQTAARRRAHANMLTTPPCLPPARRHPPPRVPWCPFCAMCCVQWNGYSTAVSHTNSAGWSFTCNNGYYHVGSNTGTCYGVRSIAPQRAHCHLYAGAARCVLHGALRWYARHPFRRPADAHLPVYLW
ncbi:hypothetical protein EON67_06930 [archaeon]|nr:MAG: hypothetical protein EON67_06930 [archaeon]